MSDTFERLKTSLLDRYRFEREVGAGGMATVYLAEDLRHRRKVAVKVLRPELTAMMGAARFRREIEIAANLHHPHILPLFDSGEVDGILYYVMPYEEGETLRERLGKAERQPIAAGIRLMRDVAGALAHAHGRGVVHRDIKPENVMLSGEHALVTDFGIAKAINEGRGSGATDPAITSLTQAGMSLGTPAYMAPEQVAGDAATDHRADIYALGVMAYEMLTGAPPFVGSSQQVLGAHLAKEPEPIASRRAEIPPALAAIVMRCLAKDPAARWQSASELVAALEEPSLQTSGAQPVAGGRSMRRLGIAAAVAVVLALAGLAWFRQEGRFGTLIGGNVLAADDLVMVAEFTNRSNDSTLAATVTDAVRIELQDSRIIRTLTQREMWDGMRRMTLEPGTALPDDKVRELAERIGVKAFVLGDVAAIGSGYQLTARVVATVDGSEQLTVRTTAANDGELIEAVGELGMKLRRGIGESLRSVAAAPTLARATTASLPALKAYTSGQRAEVLGDRQQAIALFKEAVQLDSSYAHAWAGLGVAYINNRWWQLAVAAIEQAYRWRGDLPESSQLAIESNYHGIRGEKELEAAVLRQRTEVYDEGWVSYADHLLGRGRLAEAEAASRRGIAQSPKQPVSYWNMIEAQVAQRRFEAAESTLVSMREQLPESAWPLNLMVRILEGKRDFDSITAFFTVGAGAELPWAEQVLCGNRLVRGELETWRRCTASPEMDGAGRDPHLILAELRLTGDTVRTRRQLAQLEAGGVDTLTKFSIPSLIAAYAEIGALPEARRTMARWRGSMAPDDPRYRADGPYAAGAIAMAEGKLDSAASYFLAWNSSDHLDAAHWYNRGLVEAGLALDRAGRSDSALVLYEKALSMPSISGGSFYETAWYPQVLRRLGELYEAKGQRDLALGHYSTLLTLWRDADPLLRPQVEAVKGRVAALAGETGVGP
jgi:serine/threonine-protein kinase